MDGRPSMSASTNDKEPLRRANDDRHSADHTHGTIAGSGAEPSSTLPDEHNAKPAFKSRPSGIELDDQQHSSRSSLENQNGLKKKDHATGMSTPASTREERKLLSAFAHPATKDGQQIIWVPRDSLGLGQEAVRLMHERNIEATDKDATLSEKVSSALIGAPLSPRHP